MKLNDQILGLPIWPTIEFNEKLSECVVHAAHISYPRYRLALFITHAACLIYFAFAVKIIFQQPTLGMGMGMSLKLLGALCIYVIVVRTPRILSRFVFPRKTRVKFRKGEFWIGRKQFVSSPEVAIQFRAWEMSASPERQEKLLAAKQAKKLDWDKALELKFYNVEMVYGSRIELVTSIADEKRAQQFAVALQHGLDFMARQKSQPTPVQKLQEAVAQDNLPE